MGRKLTFFDVKTKRKFSTSKYSVVKKRTKRGSVTMAKAKSPYSGITCYRILRRGRRRGRG